LLKAEPIIEDATEKLPARIWKIAAVAILGAFLSPTDATVVNVSLPTLAVELRSSLSTIQWVMSGYLLALALMLPLNGWLVDRIGAKRLYLWCFATFTLSSALCRAVWSAESLVVFRVLQGMSGGLLAPNGADDARSRCGQTHGARDGLCSASDSSGPDPGTGAGWNDSSTCFLAVAISGQCAGVSGRNCLGGVVPAG